MGVWHVGDCLHKTVARRQRSVNQSSVSQSLNQNQSHVHKGPGRQSQMKRKKNRVPPEIRWFVAAGRRCESRLKRKYETQLLLWLCESVNYVHIWLWHALYANCCCLHNRFLHDSSKLPPNTRVLSDRIKQQSSGYRPGSGSGTFTRPNASHWLTGWLDRWWLNDSHSVTPYCHSLIRELHPFDIY